MATIDLTILCQNAPGGGSIVVENGLLISGAIDEKTGKTNLDDGAFHAIHPARIQLRVDPNAGSLRTVVRVRMSSHSFSFFAGDVTREFPITIPEYGVAVTAGNDSRSYDDVLNDIRARGTLSKLQQIAAEPEESFEAAAAMTRQMHSPMWMGISRDVRIFEFNTRAPMQVADTIQPRFHGYGYFWPEEDKRLIPARYGWIVGRGWGCADDVRRYLDDGVLPILHVDRVDEDIRYEMTMFATLERSKLVAQNVRGTHYLVSDGLSVCHSFTESQQKEFESLREAELFPQEQTVLCCRVVATNQAAVPRYAFFKSLHPIHGMYGTPNTHDHGADGFGTLPETGLVFGISRIDGQPMPRSEVSVLVPPGKTAVLEFFIPHTPISRERAELLANRDVQGMLQDCRAFWRAKLDAAAKIHVPEERIDKLLKAGLLHYDLTSYGREPDGTLNGTNGVYSALASETTTNIAFVESMHLPDLARRHLDFFFDKQHDNGLMQNFIGYMLETGGVLWCAGEHFRYTRDKQWLSRIKPKLVKSADFLVKWRQENLREELRGKGYGLLLGRVADPLDEQRHFMLNGYACLGLSRVGEMLAGIDPEASKKYAGEAERFKADIRAAFFTELDRGPAIPVGDGTWCPTAGAWVGADGVRGLILDKEPRWSHGAFMLPDDILGPMHLVFQEVLDPHEQATDLLLHYYSELFFARNFAFSQPYYSRHPWLHLKRRETSAFLKAWYNGVASYSDREMLSWWEHYFHASPHKNHEEGSFLMQTRWMLWMEEEDQLSLLRGVPRAWMENGKKIQLDNVASYFGAFSLEVSSHLAEKRIDAKITCKSDRQPRRVEIRLPHPTKAKAVHAEGGSYDATNETVLIDDFKNAANVSVYFAG